MATKNKQQKLARLPIIYDAGGDLSKNWFIEFYVRNPLNNEMVRQRSYKGINKHKTLKERRQAAEKSRLEFTGKIKNGWNPMTDGRVIYDDNLQYQTFIKNYQSLKSKNGTFKFFASQYIDSIENKVAETTIQTYRSKLRLFDAWLHGQELDTADISAVGQELLFDFFAFIINERELSKVSVDNYRLLLKAVFEFVRKKRRGFTNPVVDMPGTKRLNDSAAAPINKEHIPIFKNRIMEDDPQLWLAICFEYYCYMRPRKEVRFLKIGDINFGLSQIKIRPENSKTVERWVTIPRVFMRLMTETFNLQEYPSEYFVIGKKGEPSMQSVSVNNLTNRFVRIREKLEMPFEYKLYSWKHTGVISASDAGVPDREIQQQAGHTTITTTERYMRKKRVAKLPNMNEIIPEI